LAIEVSFTRHGKEAFVFDKDGVAVSVVCRSPNSSMDGPAW